MRSSNLHGTGSCRTENRFTHPFSPCWHAYSFFWESCRTICRAVAHININQWSHCVEVIVVLLKGTGGRHCRPFRSSPALRNCSGEDTLAWTTICHFWHGPGQQGPRFEQVPKSCSLLCFCQTLQGQDILSTRDFTLTELLRGSAAQDVHKSPTNLIKARQTCYSTKNDCHLWSLCSAVHIGLLHGSGD